MMTSRQRRGDRAERVGQRSGAVGCAGAAVGLGVPIVKALWEFIEWGWSGVLF